MSASTLDVWHGLRHVFHAFPWVPETREACAEIAAFFHRHVA